MGFSEEYLVGKLLIAMPNMQDPRFERSVIYICAHNGEGAMGLVVNRLIDTITFPELLDQLDIERPAATIRDVGVHFGGPVESSRGFVLHSPDFQNDATLQVDESVAVTATVDILKNIALGQGPDRSLLALGYAGWSAGQLETEIRANGWLHVDADDELVFGIDQEDKWDRALKKIGVDVDFLTAEAGHA
jgi:putative transcriptional regulator